MSGEVPPEPPEADTPGGHAERGGDGDPGRRPTKTEVARRAYVTGAAATLEEAAAIAGASYGYVRQRSCEDGWAEQRQAQLALERARLSEEAAEGEARIQAGTRRLAWRCAFKALARLSEQLDDTTRRVTAFDVDALVRSAKALSDVGDIESDEAMRRLKRMPLPAIAAEFVEVMRAFGVEPELLDPLAVEAKRLGDLAGPSDSIPQEPADGGTPPDQPADPVA